MKTTYQNLWNTVKVALNGKFVAINDYIKKIPKLYNLMNEKKNKLNSGSRKKEIIKMRIQINEIENRKTT